jgi:hypothetical protein
MKYATTGSNRVRITVATLAVVATLCIGWVPRVHAQTGASDVGDSLRNSPCSAATVAGNWAYTETGVVIPGTVAVPFAAVARYTLDTDGNLAGTATSSSGGTAANVSLQGTGTVNDDCSGRLTVGVYALGILVRTASFDVVYLSNGREARAIVTSLILANGTLVPSVLTIDAKKLFQGSPRKR